MQQLLHEETIHLGFEAKTPKESLTKLVEKMPEWSANETQKQSILKLLLKREQFGTTAIGGGVALPHCVADVSVPTASLGISREGIVFPSLDGDPVHIIFMLVTPENDETHTILRQALHQAEKIFKDNFLKQRLKLAENSSEAFEIILRETNYLLSGLKVG